MEVWRPTLKRLDSIAHPGMDDCLCICYHLRTLCGPTTSPSRPNSMRPSSHLNLSDASVQLAWRDRGVSALIKAMERCEHWVVDGDTQYRKEAERLIDEVCASLNAADLDAIVKGVSAHPLKLIDFMGHMRTGRALAMFSWLVDLHPDIGRILLNEARFGDDEFGSILIERITTMERQFLLSRVFSPERIAIVLDLIEGEAQFH